MLFAKIGQGDVSTITTVADSSSNLAGTFTRINGFVTGKQYMFWYKVGGSGSNPATGADTAVEVDFAANATNTTVATAIYNAALANTNVVQDFTVTLSGHTVTFTALAGGCANVRDGASAFNPGFTVANTVYPVLTASSSLGIKSVTRTGTGLYTVVLGTPAPTSVIDVYNRLFFVGYCPLSASAVPAAPLCYVVSETVSSTGAINLKFTAADGTTATDPACGEEIWLEIYVKNSTGQ